MLALTPRRGSGPLVGLCLSCFLVPAPARADTPLHQQIDQAVGTALPGKLVAGPASDAEFLRRLYLDLTGMIPTSTEARAFFQDTSPDKRARLVDRLLASPEHARYQATVLDVMLMERRPAKNVALAAWLEFLRDAVAQNKPWDQLVREILAADGADPKQRHLARFYLDRDAEPNLLVRDVSRLLLGMNFQCAQCHDHPRVEDYKQEYYYGLFAYLNRTQLIRENSSKQIVLAEKADGEVSFQSVFDPAKTTRTTGPRMPFIAAVKEPVVEKGKEYVVAPAAGVRSVPRYSRRAQLGPQLARADHVAFKRNIANRLWALMMGRGLVHPLDMDTPGNPASHPELLTLLADDMAAHKFDMRYFLRQLALSQTYQRSSEPPAGLKDVEPGHYAVALLKPLSPEQLAWSLMQATGIVENTRKGLGAQATEAAIFGRLAGNVGPFVTAFSGPAGTAESFDARLEQALFLANGPTVRSWLPATGGNLTARLAAAANNDALAEELYMSVFTRLPTSEERKDTADFLAGRQADRPRALQDLVWALLTSAEFRFNH